MNTASLVAAMPRFPVLLALVALLVGSRGVDGSQSSSTGSAGSTIQSSSSTAADLGTGPFSYYPDSYVPGGGSYNTELYGNMFTVLVDGYVTHLRQYQKLAPNKVLPTTGWRLALWNQTTQLATVFLATADIQDGWNDVFLPTPVAVTASTPYSVCFTNIGGLAPWGAFFHVDNPFIAFSGVVSDTYVSNHDVNYVSNPFDPATTSSYPSSSSGTDIVFRTSLPAPPVSSSASSSSSSASSASSSSTGTAIASSSSADQSLSSTNVAAAVSSSSSADQQSSSTVTVSSGADQQSSSTVAVSSSADQQSSSSTAAEQTIASSSADQQSISSTAAGQTIASTGQQQLSSTSAAQTLVSSSSSSSSTGQQLSSSTGQQLSSTAVAQLSSSTGGVSSSTGSDNVLVVDIGSSSSSSFSVSAFLTSSTEIAIIAAASLGAVSTVATVVVKMVGRSYKKISTKEDDGKGRHGEKERRVHKKHKTSSRSQSRVRDYTVDVPSADLSSMPCI